MLKFCDRQAYFGGGNCLLDVFNYFVNILASVEFYFLHHLFETKALKC